MSMSLVYHKYMCAMMMNEQNVSMECRHSMNGTSLLHSCSRLMSDKGEGNCVHS